MRIRSTRRAYASTLTKGGGRGRHAPVRAVVSVGPYGVKDYHVRSENHESSFKRMISWNFTLRLH